MSTSPFSPRRSQRRRIQPYIPHDLHKRFAAFCAANGTSESAVAQAALTQYLDRTGDYPAPYAPNGLPRSRG